MVYRSRCRLRMLEWESIRSIEIEFSIRSSRQKRTVWAWAWRFAEALSKHLAAGYGRPRTLILGRLFVSRFRLRQRRGYERALRQIDARHLPSRGLPTRRQWQNEDPLTPPC